MCIFGQWPNVIQMKNFKWIKGRTSDSLWNAGPWSVWMTSGLPKRPIWLSMTDAVSTAFVDLVGNNSAHRHQHASSSNAIIIMNIIFAIIHMTTIIIVMHHRHHHYHHQHHTSLYTIIIIIMHHHYHTHDHRPSASSFLAGMIKLWKVIVLHCSV